MPLSGAVYWRYGNGVGAARSLVLIEEMSLVSAFQIDARRYAGIQVQPSGVARADAVRRLLHAVDATFPEVRQVQYWSVTGNHEQHPLIAECLPGARIDRLDIMRWH